MEVIRTNAIYACSEEVPGRHNHLMKEKIGVAKDKNFKSLVYAQQ